MRDEGFMKKRINNEKVNEINNSKINIKKSILFFAVISIIMFSFMFMRRALIDDGAFHLGRLQALSDDISWTNLKPWIYSKTFFGTGYPLGIFYPDLFLYPFALLAKTAIGAYYSYIIMMMCMNFTCLVSFYLCIRKILIYRSCEKYEEISFVMTLCYLIFPYRLWDFYARMAIGECMFFVFFPIAMLGVYELFYNKKFSLALFFAMTGILYSHILSTAILIAALVVYYVFHVKTLIKYPRIILYTAINAVLTILCGLSVILPILEMQSFTELYYTTGEKSFGMLKEHVICMINNDVISVIVTIIFFIVCGIIVYKVDLKSKLMVVIAVIIFMCTDLFCWGALEEAIPFLNILQFPWRLLGISSIPICVLVGKVLYKHKPLYIGFTVLFLMVFVFLGMVSYIDIENINMYGEYSTGKGEYETVELHKYYLKHQEIPKVKEEYCIEQQGDVYSFKTQDGSVVLPLAYYKGYKITDAGKAYDYGIDTGLIKVTDVEGDHLKVEYEGTVIQKGSLLISIVTFILICCINLIVKMTKRG